MNKTAVEWLLEHLERNIMWTDKAEKIAEQAKEMEKQQITYAYAIGAVNGEMIERDLKPKYTNPIHYYNETFKSK